MCCIRASRRRDTSSHRTASDQLPFFLLSRRIIGAGYSVSEGFKELKVPRMILGTTMYELSDTTEPENGSRGSNGYGSTQSGLAEGNQQADSQATGTTTLSNSSSG